MPSHEADSPTDARRERIAAVLLRAQEQGGLCLFVDGLAGMGKTMVLRELASQALASDAWVVTFVGADSVEGNEPFAFTERFLASGVTDSPDIDLGATPQPIPVAQAVLRILMRPADGRGRVIIVDDAQWVDPESARVLRYLIPRLVRRNVVVAVGARSPHTSGSLSDFLTDLTRANPLDVAWTLGPLTTAEVQALAVERFGVGISAKNADQLRRRTGGSFLGIDSIFGQLTAAEVSQLHLSWSIPIRGEVFLENPLLHRFHTLSDDGKFAAQIVALADHELARSAVTSVARVLGFHVDLCEAIAAGVLSESGFGSTIIPAHDLIGHAIVDTVEPERARAVYRALADVTDGYRAMQHALKAAVGLDEGLFVRVRDYAREALERGAFVQASVILREGLGLVPRDEASSDGTSAEAGWRNELLIDLAFTHLRNNSGYEIVDLSDDYRRLPESRLKEFLLILVDAHQVGAVLPADRVRQVMRPTTDPDELTMQAFLAFMLVIMTMRSRETAAVPMLIEQARALFRAAPTDPASLFDPRLAWMVSPEEFLVLIDTYTIVGLHRGMQMDQTRQALAGLRPRVDAMADVTLKVDVLIAAAGAYVALGEVPAAREYALRAQELSGRVSKPWAAGTLWLIVADCHIRMGEYPEAAHALDVIESQAFDVLDVETRPVAAVLRAVLAAITGAGDPAAHLERAQRFRQITWEGYSPDLVVIATCAVARARGDDVAILEATQPEQVSGIVNTQRAFDTYRAHALINLGRLDDAETLIAELAAARGNGWHETVGSLPWLQARLHEARGETAAAADRYAEAVEHRTYPLPRAIALADYGEFLAATGDLPSGAQQLRASVALLERIGAGAYLDRVRVRLDGLPEQFGQRRRASPEDSVPISALTTREAEIAGYLAQGRSNQEIAQHLFVSQATVRFHVSNILRKLGVNSRAKVAAVLNIQGPNLQA